MSARHRGLFYKLRLPLRFIGIALLVILCLGFAYFLTLLGPQKVGESDFVATELSSEEISVFLDESEQLRKEYEQASLLREPTEDDIALLNRSVERLEVALEAAGGSNRDIREKLEEARRHHHTEAGARLLKESLAIETELGQLPEDSIRQRIQLTNRALILQESINDDFPLSPARNPRRAVRLENERNSLQARPLYKKTMDAGRRADEAMNAGEWGEAYKAMNEAIETQKLLNSRYPSLGFADVNRLSQLERELVSLESARVYQRINESEKAGLAAMEEGQFREAAAAFQTAMRQQESLNNKFPSSRFASIAKIEEFKVLQENALGTELANDILEQIQTLDKSLRDRKVWEATELIQGLAQQIEQFNNSYPRNTSVDEVSRQKIAYLLDVQMDLSLLQDRIYGQLIPIPEAKSGWHMSRTEVTQALFTSVMKSNPSRNRGERSPVDSVTWDDAKKFCAHTGWILGREVRLPNQNEFLNAIGSLRYVNLNDISWNAQNSDGLTQTVATKEADKAGFYDLLGNVSEWLESATLPGETEAYLAGGNAETSIDALADKPIEIVNRRMRNRMNGFRFAVDLNP